MKVVAVFVLSAGLVLGAACTDQRQELMEQLVDRSPVKRAAAVRSLPSEGGEDAYMLVTKALTDHSTIVRIAAVHALADIKDRDTTAAMIRATRDADPEVRQVAVAKLVAHNKGKAKTVLMNMLLNGEPNIQVRQNIYSELSRLDLSGEKLAEQMVISRIGKINEVWDKSMPAQRVRLVLEAGRLYHADGVGIVLRGLADSDAAVALAALAAVDGRGGKQALRLLIKLASDQSEKIRMAAVGSLSKYGSDGLVVLKGALRDVEPNVRTAALREITKISGKLDPALACSLLEVKEEKTLIEVIGLLKTQGIECPLTTFASWLENPELELYQTAINVLAASANDEARGLLKAEFKKRPANLKPMLGVALARSGDSSAQLAKYLKGELKKFSSLLGNLLSDLSDYQDFYISGGTDCLSRLEHFVKGLVKCPKKKANCEGIADQVEGHDGQSINHFVSESFWDAFLVMDRITVRAWNYLSQYFDKSMIGLIIDESGFKKHGRHSVCVGRQWLGSLGKQDNGQVFVGASLCAGKL